MAVTFRDVPVVLLFYFIPSHSCDSCLTDSLNQELKKSSDMALVVVDLQQLHSFRSRRLRAFLYTGIDPCFGNLTVENIFNGGVNNNEHLVIRSSASYVVGQAAEPGKSDTSNFHRHKVLNELVVQMFLAGECDVMLRLVEEAAKTAWHRYRGI